MWILRALWLVVAHDLLEYRYMDDVTGNLFPLLCSTWRAVLKMFVWLFQWHTRLRLVRHFFVFTTFWRHLWSITKETHGKIESIVKSATKWTSLAVFPAHFSLRRYHYLIAWNRLVQCKKRLWTHNTIRIKLTLPSLPPPPSSPKLCSEIYSLVSWIVCLLVCSFVYSLNRVKASHRDEYLQNWTNQDALPVNNTENKKVKLNFAYFKNLAIIRQNFHCDLDVFICCFPTYKTNITSNNQRLRSVGNNNRRSKRFCSSAVLCVSFVWQMIKTRVIRLPVIEGRNTLDRSAFCAFHTFLVEVRSNAGYIHATHA